MRSQLFVAVLLIVLSCISAEWVTKHLSSPRARTTAAQVGNKVYIAGGEIDNMRETDLIEVLNLDSLEREESNLTLNTLRQQFTATSVGSNIYFAGGFYHQPTILTYDYVTSNFSRLPRAPWAVNIKNIVAMNDNRTIYVFTPNTLDIYHRDNNTWTTNQEYRALVNNLYQAGLAVVDGTAFIVGGFDKLTRKLTNTAYTMDLTTGIITKFEGAVLPQYFPSDMAVDYSANGVVMCGAINSTASFTQMCNVYNRQTKQWLSSYLVPLFGGNSIASPTLAAMGAVTDNRAFIVLPLSSSSVNQGSVMVVNLSDLSMTMLSGSTVSGISGKFYGITATATNAFLIAEVSGSPALIIFDQNAAVAQTIPIPSLGSSPDIRQFIPWGSDASCFWASSTAIGCFSASGLSPSFAPLASIIGYAVLNDNMYFYNPNGYYRFATPTSAPDSFVSVPGPLLGVFDDHVASATTVFAVGSATTQVGTVGGDSIPTSAAVITQRGSISYDAHFLALDPSSVIVYPSTIEVLNTLNNSWTEFDLPFTPTDTNNIIYAGALGDNLVLVCTTDVYFVNTTSNEIMNTTLPLAQDIRLRTHLQLPVYNDKLITGISKGISQINTTTSSPLPQRSDSSIVINQLLVYDNKLFVTDVAANQFYFYVLSQNRWDARLLSGKRNYYSIAAVDFKVFIIGGRTDTLSTPGYVSSDSTFYFEFNTGSSSLSQPINITYPRSEITPISTPDAAIFIGGLSSYSQYFDLLEIYTNRTVNTPIVEPTGAGPVASPEATPPGTIAGAVVGSVVGAVGIGLGVFFILRAKKKKAKKAQRMATIRTTVNLDDAIAKHPMYTPFAEIKFGKMLGSGANGQVFLGRWKSTDVALKVSMSQANEGFIQEVNLMLGLRPHPNVVRIFGFSIHPETQNVILILEFCDGGSLDNILFDDPNDIPISKKLAWIQGIARGVLHLQSNNIVHRDLAARNVLLHRGEAKITDFGMSRVVDEGKKGTTTSDIGPIRWMAPESIANKEYSNKSDVWSFAVIMYEIISRQEPHVAGDPLEIAVKIRDQGATPGIPEDCPEQLAYIMNRCWQKDPQNRATFQEITDYLDKLKL